MTHPIRTVLWFNGHGRDAAEFYCTHLPDSRIDAFYASDHGGPDGDMHFEVIDFTLNGTPYQILDAGPMFPLSECVSILVETPDQAETDRLWDAIVNNGGRESDCGWCKDRWGLSWQITPRTLTDALAAGGDEAKRAFAAMMTMQKIDVAAIDAARRG